MNFIKKFNIYIILFIIIILIYIVLNPKLFGISYLLCILIFIFLSKSLFQYIYYLLFNPIKFDTYADFIPSLYIEKDLIVNNNNTYSSIIEIKGFKYAASHDLSEAQQINFEIRARAFNLSNLRENSQIKFLFKRYKIEEGFHNSNFIEVTSSDKEVVKDVAHELLNTLSEYNPILLETKELQNFIFYNSNLVKRNIKGTYTENDKDKFTLNDTCSYSQIYINENEGLGEIENLDIKKCFTAVSINFGKEIDLNYFFELITKNIEFDYVFNTLFFTNLAAKGTLDTEFKNIEMGEDDRKLSVSELKKEETMIAQQCILNEEDTLTMGDIFIILYADTDEELKSYYRILQSLCSKYDILLNKETSLTLYYFMQRLSGFRFNNTIKFLLPYGEITAYAKKILTHTIAGCFDYIHTPEGLSKCDWGVKPICILNTSYNNAYKFYMHVSEQQAAVGHGVVIAPTGGGKTTFVQYLMKGILKSYEDVDIYSFDRFNGMKIFTYWQQGKNVNFDEGQINPLQIDLEKQENVDFLYNFLHMLCKTEITLDKNFNRQLEIFIESVKKLPYEMRTFKTLKKLEVLSTYLLEILSDWIDGRYSHYVNAEKDSFTLDNRLLTFQMDKILEDERLSAPIIYYIMFKIRHKSQKENRGHFIFIDEAAGMIKNPFFKNQIEIMLNEHRKLRGCVWLAFQNSNTFLDDKKLKEIILSQCQNQIIFTSNSLNQKVLNELKIDNTVYEEIERAKKNNKDPYYILIKRPNENVIVNINLLKKEEPVALYSSTTSDINKVEKLRINNKQNWIDIYLSEYDKNKSYNNFNQYEQDFDILIFQDEINKLSELIKNTIESKLPVNSKDITNNISNKK